MVVKIHISRYRVQEASAGVVVVPWVCLELVFHEKHVFELRFSVLGFRVLDKDDVWLHAAWPHTVEITTLSKFTLERFLSIVVGIYVHRGQTAPNFWDPNIQQWSLGSVFHEKHVSELRFVWKRWEVFKTPTFEPSVATPDTNPVIPHYSHKTVPERKHSEPNPFSVHCFVTRDDTGDWNSLNNGFAGGQAVWKHLTQR